MKPIVARDQVRLGAGRCWQLALTGMSYRLFRSSITIAILALASAFLVHILGHGILAEATERCAYAEMQMGRRLGQDITRLSVADSTAVVLQTLVSGDAQRLSEYSGWAAIAPQQLAEAQASARRLAQAGHALSNLPVAAHAVIFGDATVPELFDRLAHPEAFSAFLRQAHQLGVPCPGGDCRRFERLLMVERPALDRLIDKIQAGQERAIERLSKAFGGEPLAQVIAAAAPSLLSELKAAGFDIDSTRLLELSRFAQRAEDVRGVSKLLTLPDVATAVAHAADVAIGKVNFDVLSDYVDTDKRAHWLEKILRSAGAPKRLTAQRLAELVGHHRRERQLSRAVGDREKEPETGVGGLPSRTEWLVLLSFLVCVVGVANAMLMSVTERFTEIATMKCLGAMDRFVMLMFVFEAVIQGAVGGLFGVLLGTLLAVARAALEYGSLLAAAASAAGTVGLAVLGSLLATVLLAAVAAVGPSFVAARLSPMEAMRVE